jgi:hypothetical protein
MLMDFWMNPVYRPWQLCSVPNDDIDNDDNDDDESYDEVALAEVALNKFMHVLLQEVEFSGRPQKRQQCNC